MPPIIDWQLLLRVPPKPVGADAAGSIWATDIPAWITAIATAGLLIGAYFTARYARKAFLGQADQLAEQRKINAKQTEVLELQAAELRESIEDRKRETEQRRRAQASRVFIWEEPGEDEVNFPPGSPPAPWVTAWVVNTSEQPIYNVIISWHLGHMPEGQRYLTPLMPGAEAKDTRSVPPDTDPAIFGAVAFFRDAAGVIWRTRPGGQLEEIPPGQEPPHTW